MGKIVWTRETASAALVAKGVRADIAALYADAFCEYHEAVANVSAHGAIVQQPRTGNPIVNPYVAIRDGAWRRLQSPQFRRLPMAVLW